MQDEKAELDRLVAETGDASYGLIVLGGGSGAECYAVTADMVEPMQQRVQRAIGITQAAERLAAVTDAGPVLQCA